MYRLSVTVSCNRDPGRTCQRNRPVPVTGHPARLSREKKMEAFVVYWGNIGITEKKLNTFLVYSGNIDGEDLHACF